MPSAHAQQKTLKSGMQHIIVSKPQAPEKPDVQPITRSEKDQEIWQKYKALAAGTQEKTEEKPKIQPPTSNLQPPKPTGLAAIIADYRKNKEQQRDMKTLRFDPPTVNKTP